jgi:coproporphyrinogen III oxidase
MSLHHNVQWVYDHHQGGSEEEKLVNVLENPRDCLLRETEEHNL